MGMFDTLVGWAGGGQGLVSTGLAAAAGLFDADRNARAAADQRQADERGAERQMAFQSGEAATARQYAERLSGSAHQRQVADMRAAGLNPILSATGGHGASSPTVAAPSGSKAGATLQTGSTAGRDFFNSSQAAQRQIEELKNMRETNTLIRAQTDFAKSQAAYNSVLYNRGLAETETEKERGREMFHQANIRAHEYSGKRTEGEIDESDYGRILRYLDRMNPMSNSAGRIRDMFRERR